MYQKAGLLRKPHDKVLQIQANPTEHQVKILNDTIETCRHLYNNSLGERSAGWGIGYWEQTYILPLRKHDNKYYKCTVKSYRMYCRGLIRRILHFSKI
ncbi:putative transposase [Candidatus Nitrososphaera gargensis Ga9.2]|uniref:Putative transposase n=1 Tax=Nitrososphaera gargensis (strain Ga9.2) TaxID=1237085 RepID=K0IHS8_NITGG|nr:helix-turn-helix domain-containing protein [Candidatus Nitrososphaera gargensis]AFU57407.1 putative transposase [Candidatus Nitrososphaera gargensis Ga9.2]